ncbi:phage tail protein [Serratia fonticola]|uniref:phage tail protein n=1 Tax=Serratia fonticola TaxID=47917 RepID=UPI001377FAF7|nr:phage tail protein [Serratia fonticola]NCG53838.1 phage tail protein [Serratia fonticola]
MNLYPWLAEPNWHGGITETLEWKTDVLPSPTGAEQRIARRLSPRRTFEFSILVGNNDKQRFENALFIAGAAEWAMPVFADVAVLDVDHPAGATHITVPTVGRDFTVGGSVLLMSGLGLSADVGLAIVTGISASAITLATPLPVTWSAGACVYPLRPAVLTDPPSLTRHTDSLLSAQIRFRVTEHNANSDSIQALPVYRHHPVLEPASDWSEPVTGQYLRMLQELDNGSGIPVRTDTARRAFTLMNHHWVSVGREKQAALRRLFYYLRGRQRAIWVSSGCNDFTPVSGLENGVIHVEYAAFAELGVVNGRCDLRIHLVDGSSLYRRITGVAVVNYAVERLVLDGDHITVALEQIVSISYLTLCRQESDSVAWQHVTDADGLATISTTFRGIRDELESV